MKRLIALACLGLVACTTIDTTSVSDPIAVVEKRALTRWEALIRSDIDAAYQYLTPATRSTVSLERYRTKVKPGLWRSAKVDSVKCEAELCKAKMVVKYDLREIKDLETQVEETWLKENDTWWYVWKG